MQAEFERHIETRQLRIWRKLNSADVMDAEAAFADDPNEFLEARRARVIDFARRTWRAAASGDSENRRAHDRVVIFVEGTVDEDLIFFLRFHRLYFNILYVVFVRTKMVWSFIG